MAAKIIWIGQTIVCVRTVDDSKEISLPMDDFLKDPKLGQWVNVVWGMISNRWILQK